MVNHYKRIKFSYLVPVAANLNVVDPSIGSKVHWKTAWTIVSFACSKSIVVALLSSFSILELVALESPLFQLLVLPTILQLFQYFFLRAWDDWQLDLIDYLSCESSIRVQACQIQAWFLLVFLSLSWKDDVRLLIHLLQMVDFGLALLLRNLVLNLL